VASGKIEAVVGGEEEKELGIRNEEYGIFLIPNSSFDKIIIPSSLCPSCLGAFV